MPIRALTTRQQRTLLTVCRAYVATGQPVSSRSLVEDHGFPWSSATLRNELASLERLGLLQQPHPSSGRLPTVEGLQHYVDLLEVPTVPDPGLAQAVDRSVGDHSSDPVKRLRAAVWVLSQALDCVAVSFVGEPQIGRIRQLDLVPLVERRALVVLTMEDGSTRVVPVSLTAAEVEDRFADHAVTRAQERLRWLFVGRTLDEARSVLIELLRGQQAELDRMLSEAVRVGWMLCTAAALDPLWLQVAGQPSLARALGSGDTHVLGHMLELLEDYQRLAEVLCQLFPLRPGVSIPKAEVRVDAGGLLGEMGAQGPEPTGRLPGLTVVGCRLPGPEGEGHKPQTGAIALLGPDRMDFAAVIPLVEYAARALVSPACA